MHEYDELLEKVKKIEEGGSEKKEVTEPLKQKVVKLSDSAYMWVIASEK